jgi:hypothetical protein
MRIRQECNEKIDSTKIICNSSYGAKGPFLGEKRNLREDGEKTTENILRKYRKRILEKNRSGRRS